MLDTLERPRTKTAPAQGWRNYYRIYRVLYLLPLGTVFPGLHAGPSLFETKDIAEAHARTFIGDLNRRGRTIVEHAGAYREGGRPN